MVARDVLTSAQPAGDGCFYVIATDWTPGSVASATVGTRGTLAGLTFARLEALRRLRAGELVGVCLTFEDYQRLVDEGMRAMGYA